MQRICRTLSIARDGLRLCQGRRCRSSSVTEWLYGPGHLISISLKLVMAQPIVVDISQHLPTRGSEGGRVHLSEYYRTAGRAAVSRQAQGSEISRKPSPNVPIQSLHLLTRRGRRVLREEPIHAWGLAPQVSAMFFPRNHFDDWGGKGCGKFPSRAMQSLK